MKKIIKSKKFLFTLSSLFLLTSAVTIGTSIGIATTQQKVNFNNNVKLNNLQMIDSQLNRLWTTAHQYFKQNKYNINIGSSIRFIPVLPEQFIDKSYEFLGQLANNNNILIDYIATNASQYLSHDDLRAIPDYTNYTSNEQIYDNANGIMHVIYQIKYDKQWYDVAYLTYSGFGNYSTFLNYVLKRTDLKVPRDQNVFVPNVHKWSYSWWDWAKIEYVLTQTIYQHLLKFRWFFNQANNKYAWKTSPNNDQNRYIPTIDHFYEKGNKISTGDGAINQHQWTHTSFIQVKNHAAWKQVAGRVDKLAIDVNIYLPVANVWINVRDINIIWKGVDGEDIQWWKIFTNSAEALYILADLM